MALGKSFLQFSAMKMAHAPPGHHSVIGRPSAGGLHFPEYVVYRGEQVRTQKGRIIAVSSFDSNCVFPTQAYPEYLITYQIVKPDDSLSGNEESTR